MHQQTVCTTCGIANRWQPTIVEGKPYCCLGCAEGGPCACDYDNLPQQGVMNPLVIQAPDFRQNRESG